MPRFSEWAAERGPEVTVLEAVYLVNNGLLHSKSNGIFFRQKPDLAKKATKLAPFGTTVRGVPYNVDWLEVGDLYLPMSVDGVEVLMKVDGVKGQEADFDVLPHEQEASHLPAWLLGAPAAGNGAKAAGEADRKPRPVEIVEDFRKPRPPAGGSGTGEWYEVIATRAVIRSQPSVNAHMENIKNRGEFVELFEWDDRQEWRRCKDSWQAGWMLIRHSSLGQLLMPVDSALLVSVKPMCEAIMTNDLRALRTWLSQVSKKDLQRLGPGALTMAAARGFLDCFVVLIEAGVDAESMVEAGTNSSGLREPAATQALARALTGLDFKMADFDAALARLEPAQQQLAERLFDQAAEDHKAQRRGQARFAYANIDESDEEGDRRGPADGWEDEVVQREAPRQDFAAGQAVAAHEEASPPAEEEHNFAEVIVRRVAVREEPELSAAIVAEFRQGDRATLLEYDETSAWRRVRAKDTSEFGWTLLRHKTLGELWKILERQQEEVRRSPKQNEDWDTLFGK